MAAAALCEVHDVGSGPCRLPTWARTRRGLGTDAAQCALQGSSLAKSTLSLTLLVCICRKVFLRRALKEVRRPYIKPGCVAVVLCDNTVRRDVFGGQHTSAWF